MHGSSCTIISQRYTIPYYEKVSYSRIKKRVNRGKVNPLVWERVEKLLLQYQLDVGVLQARTLDFSQGLVYSVLLID